MCQAFAAVMHDTGTHCDYSMCVGWRVCHREISTVTSGRGAKHAGQPCRARMRATSNAKRKALPLCGVVAGCLARGNSAHRQRMVTEQLWLVRDQRSWQPNFEHPPPPLALSLFPYARGGRHTPERFLGNPSLDCAALGRNACSVYLLCSTKIPGLAVVGQPVCVCVLASASRRASQTRASLGVLRKLLARGGKAQLEKLFFPSFPPFCAHTTGWGGLEAWNLGFESDVTGLMTPATLCACGVALKNWQAGSGRRVWAGWVGARHHSHPCPPLSCYVILGCGHELPPPPPRSSAINTLLAAAAWCRIQSHHQPLHPTHLFKDPLNYYYYHHLLIPRPPHHHAFHREVRATPAAYKPRSIAVDANAFQRHLQDPPCHHPPASRCLPRARLWC